MPELPDVESFKRYLDATSLHQRIAHVDVLSAYVLKGISARELAHRLKGRCFESSRRHGKHLFVRTDGDVWLRLHFGMTGSLRYFKGEEKAPPHTRVLTSAPCTRSRASTVWTARGTSATACTTPLPERAKTG